ncbi:permease [Gordonia sp. NPDC003376]
MGALDKAGSTPPPPPPPPAKVQTGWPSWAKKTVWTIILIAVVVAAYFILAAFLPRWWAQRVGNMASESMGQGILTGLGFGLVCTLLTLLFLFLAFGARRWSRRSFFVPVFLILAIVASIPNLLTLGIVLGAGNGAHAGERILDVQAPGFRGATLIGVIIGVVIFVAIALVGFQMRRRPAKGAAAPAPTPGADGPADTPTAP